MNCFNYKNHETDPYSSIPHIKTKDTYSYLKNAKIFKEMQRFPNEFLQSFEFKSCFVFNANYPLAYKLLRQLSN